MKKFHWERYPDHESLPEQRLLELWNNEYPVNIQHQDISGIRNYLNSISNAVHYLCYSNVKEIVGWYVDFDRDDERWFAMILDSSVHKMGLGREMLKIAKRENSRLLGWVIDNNDYLKTDGTKYSSPLPFYLKNGFQMEEGIRLKTDQLDTVRICWEQRE